VLAPPTLEPLLVRVDGSWLRDARGRVVLLRGVNYLHDEPLAVVGHGAREEDFAFLASLGFNLIRLPVPWEAVEPRPGEHDLAHLRNEVDPLLRSASNHGMQVVLALDRPGARSCQLAAGGAPSWTCAATDASPAAPGFGPRDAIAAARAERARCSFFRKWAAPDGRSLRAHYVDTWAAIARYYDQDRRILGFDLLDEPSPGTCFAPATFVDDVLREVYTELAQAVRSAGAPQALVFQPAITRDDPLLGVPPLPDAAVVAPHLFGQSFGAPAEPGESLDALYVRAMRLAADAGAPLLVGEIGADASVADGRRTATPTFLQESLDQLDRHLIGGAIWAFAAQGADPATARLTGIGTDADDTVVARPYARRIAGVPVATSFDATTRTFTLRFADDPAASPPDPTEIFLPARRRYPEGFAVELTAGDRWTFDEHNQRLLVYRGPATTHDVRVVPQPAHGGR